MSTKTCLITQGNGKTCGRTAKARTLAGPVCGIHAKAEEKRGGEVTPLIVRRHEFGNLRHWVTVTAETGHISASEYDGRESVAYRRFTPTEWNDAVAWANHVLRPLGTRLNDDKPRDNSGYLYLQQDGFAWRVTECCEAATTYTGDGDHVCKACYRTVDEAYGDLPVLGDAEPNPVGRIVVSLTEAEKVIFKCEDFADNGEQVGPFAIVRPGVAAALGQQPWVTKSHAEAEAQRLGIPFVEA